MSIRKKMAEGAFWVLLEKLGAQGVSFVVFTIIARFIGPEEYGLVSLCYIYLAIAYTLFSSAVDGVVNLHIKDDLRLSSLFWSVTAGGLILSILCYASAVPFAMAMGQPRLVSLLRWFATLPFLFSLSSVPTVLVTTSMNFRIFTVRTIVATSISGVVGIVMAIKGFGAYAIVAQQMTLYLVINIIIWPGSGWHPRFMFDFKELLGILKPGMKMSGSLVINFFEQMIPRLFIGPFLGPEAVGNFSFVTRICQTLQELIIYPLSIVSYPALSRLLHDTDEQKRILSPLIMLSGGVTFPLVTWAIITAPVYIPLFFGSKWDSAILPMQIYFVVMVCLSLTTILRDCMRAYNRMGAYLKVQAFLTSSGLLAAWILIPHGLAFMMSGLVVVYLFSIPIYIELVVRNAKLQLWQNFLRLWVPLLASVVMAAVLYLFNASSYRPEPLWLRLFVDTVLGGVIYVALYSVFQFRQMSMVVNFLKEELSRRFSQTGQEEFLPISQNSMHD